MHCAQLNSYSQCAAAINKTLIEITAPATIIVEASHKNGVRAAAILRLDQNRELNIPRITDYSVLKIYAFTKLTI